METLSDEALKLPPRERVAFAEQVLASIDSEEETIRQTWVTEVRERMKAVEEGKAKLMEFQTFYFRRQ